VFRFSESPCRLVSSYGTLNLASIHCWFHITVSRNPHFSSTQSVVFVFVVFRAAWQRFVLRQKDKKYIGLSSHRTGHCISTSFIHLSQCSSQKVTRESIRFRIFCMFLMQFECVVLGTKLHDTTLYSKYYTTVRYYTL